MKQYWIKLDQWAMALSLRERLMAFGAAGAVLVFLPYQLVLEPGWAKQRAMRDMMQQQRAQVAAIEGELAQLDAASSLDPDKELRQRLLRLQEDSAALRVSLRTAQKGMVAPEKMSPLLQQMVQGHGKLRLVSLKTMPPQGMVDGQFPASTGDEPAATTSTPAVAASLPTPLAAPAPAAAGATPAPAPAAPPQPSLLFRHGVQLVLEGSYPDMVNYLQALEHMPTRLFWGGAALDAQKYPQARLTLTLYTLSLDQKWIAL
jgi:MSHA biogenesis protein MshJ